ncbi:MAG: acetylglutamate kinase [Phototrophicales bacterium]|nr:MAG: acetylglutamate kinase [Phototrophicales bacterium]RMG76123.1 MAG: acetylglutamate kinase [Chloroflexota bacterium]
MKRGKEIKILANKHHKKTNRPIIIKVSGHEISDKAFLRQFATVIYNLSEPVIIVHGGGAEISTMQQTLGIEPQYINGIRITDERSMDVVSMVLAGLINKRVVQHLIAAGVDAWGISGVDNGLIRAREIQDYTGEVVSVKAAMLYKLLDQHITPVIAPVCLGDATHGIYNVNADHVAGAIGATINANKIIFITNVPGVLKNGTLLKTLNATQAQSLIADGTISGGMIPKVQTALHMLEMGIQQAVITDLDGLTSHGGTVIE